MPPRVSSVGDTVFPGHIGTIYQAHNAIYLGRGQRRSLHQLPDGSIFSARAAQKIRAGERGWRYAVEQLVEHGARPLGDEDRALWLREALLLVSTTIRHPGMHRYAWTLQRRDRRHLPTSLPYPKIDVSRCA